MTLICLCGQHHEHPALDPWPRQCARCGACWRCGQAWPALCRCPALLFPYTIQEALRVPQDYFRLTLPGRSPA